MQITETLTTSVTYSIEIVKIEKTIPDDEIENFKEWLKNKAVELGLGKQYEYYEYYLENYLYNIPVLFYVKLV